MVEALNDRLWTYDDASFLPHGAAGDGDPTTQPVFLTDRIENPNARERAGRARGRRDEPRRRRLRSRRSACSTAATRRRLGEARREWKRLKDEGFALSYWREGDDGGWEKAR